MKKEYLQISIIVLVTFLIGLFIGTQLNDSGRYQKKDYNNGVLIFDTKTGVYYLKEVSDYGRVRYFKGDVENASRLEYKSKKSKK